MDTDEDSNAEAASARKRQKRHDSDDEDESSSSRSAAGDATMDIDSSAAPAVEEKTAVVSETEIGTQNNTNTSSNDYNNDNDDDDGDSNREGGVSSQQILPQVETAGGNDESMAPPEEAATKFSLLLGALSPAAASALLPIFTPLHAIDSDDNDEANPGTSNGTDTSPTFNQRNIPSTRSYRRITVDPVATLESSSDSVSAAAAPALPSVDEEPEVAAEAAEPNPIPNDDDEQSSSDADTINSRVEDDFWTHYSSSSTNSSSDGGMMDHSDWIEPEPNAADRENIDFAVNEIMYKDKPPYTWISANELMQREHNIINRIGWRGGHTSVQSFGRGFYGSRHVVEQMSLWKTMKKHNGCVNCLNFNRAGDLLCSGSDDTRIIVWDWANDKPLHVFKSGHHTNIFQTKFIDSAGCLDIVSTSRDGQVRRAVIPPSGGDTKPTRLYTHSDAVHKLVVVPHTKHEVMSAGEDGAVKHFDLRTSTSANTMLKVGYTDPNRRGQRSRVRLFSISHHPFAPEFCVSGADDNLRVYDKRKLPEPIHEMTPRGVRETKITQITCAVYNHSGSEILASYSDAGIFLYDTRNYKEGESLHCYEGHVNHRTIKGVNFFGPRSEYVVSGSDCGHIFFWDKNTESIINHMKGDMAGVVNCLEPHPWMPVLATSGLEHTVKIWTPDAPAKQIPKPDGLRETLYRNFRRSIWETVGEDNASQQGLLFFRQFLDNPSTMARWHNRRYRRRNRAAASADADAAPGALPEHDQNSSSATSSVSDNSSMYRRRDSSSSESNHGEAYEMRCNTQ